MTALLLTQRMGRLWKSGPSPEMSRSCERSRAWWGTKDSSYIGFTRVARPLNRLTAKGVRWQWSQDKQEKFDHLKNRLMEVLIIAYLDPANGKILATDASNRSLGAVLSHV